MFIVLISAFFITTNIHVNISLSSFYYIHVSFSTFYLLDSLLRDVIKKYSPL